MNFGFSYIGFLFVLMLIVPNVLWSKYIPQDYQSLSQKENRVFVGCERIGQVLMIASLVIFKDFNIHTFTIDIIWLVLACCMMLLYEVYWIRYVKSSKTMEDFYQPLFKIPLPGATLPIIGCFLLGIYGHNVLLIISTIIFGIGHIGIHWAHYKELG